MYKDVKIILIENFPCETRKELNKREGHHMLLNKEIIVNKCIAGRTRNEGMNADYIENPDKFKKRNKEQYIKHSDKRKEQQKAYYIEHKEQVKIYNKAYGIEHKEQIKAYDLKNKDRKNMLRRERIARAKLNGGASPAIGL